MKNLTFLTLSLFSIIVASAKTYKITEEDKAFKDAKKSGKAIAYVFG